MQDDPRYDDVVAEVRRRARRRAWSAAVDAGVPRERICVDPGIGFGKTREHNLAPHRPPAAARRALRHAGAHRRLAQELPRPLMGDMARDRTAGPPSRRTLGRARPRRVASCASTTCGAHRDALRLRRGDRGGAVMSGEVEIRARRAGGLRPPRRAAGGARARPAVLPRPRAGAARATGACDTDELADAIDYGARGRARAGAVALGARTRLLERLADDIAARPAGGVRARARSEVRVRKPSAPVAARPIDTVSRHRHPRPASRWMARVVRRASGANLGDRRGDAARPRSTELAAPSPACEVRGPLRRRTAPRPSAARPTSPTTSTPRCCSRRRWRRSSCCGGCRRIELEPRPRAHRALGAAHARPRRAAVGRRAIDEPGAARSRTRGWSSAASRSSRCSDVPPERAPARRPPRSPTAARRPAASRACIRLDSATDGA